MRLGNRMPWGLLSAWTALLTWIRCYLYLQLAQILVALAEADLNLQSNHQLGMVRTFLGERLADLDQVAADPLVGISPNLRATTQAALLRTRDLQQAFQEIRLVDVDGEVQSGTDHLGLGRRSGQSQAQAPMSLSVSEDGLGTQQVSLSVGLPHGGWLLATIPFRRLTDALRLEVNPDVDLGIRLIDERDLVAYDSHDQASIGRRPEHRSQADRIDGEARAPLVPDGRLWTLALSRSRADILAPVHEVIATIVAALLIGVIAGAIVMAWWTQGSRSRRVPPVHAFESEGGDGRSEARPDPVPAEACHGAQIHLGGTTRPARHPQEPSESLAEVRSELIRKEEQLRLALENSGVGLWDWHLPSGNVSFSDTWFTMLGYAPGTKPATVATWSDMVHPEDLPEVMATVHRHLSGAETVYRTEHRCLHRDGRWIWILDCGRVVQRTADGSAVRMIGTHVDISSLKRTESALNEARIAAEQAAQAKGDFLATMSHEIRTPMNGVLGLNSVLLGTRLDAEQRDLAETVQRSGEVLLALLNDILDLARMDAGKMSLLSEPIDVKRAASDVVALFRGQAAAKHLHLTLSCAETLPLTLGDRNRIRQVLLNLVSNAVKFTEHGSVAIRLAQLDQRVVRIEIADTGIGIPADRLDRLFQPFSQVESGLSRRFGGAGLGLIISKRLVEGMGGTLGVTTQEQVGSVFTILLPIAPVGSLQQTSTVISRDHQAPLLIAVANPVVQRVISLVLRQLGIESIQVEDGKTALETWRQGDFTAVILDQLLPEIDGLAVTHAIRAAEAASRRSRTPIIGLIDEDLTEDRQACLIAGIDEILTAPITVAAVRGVLGNWMLVKDGLAGAQGQG